MPSAQWSHAVSDYSNANAHAAPLPLFRRTYTHAHAQSHGGGPTRRTHARMKGCCQSTHDEYVSLSRSAAETRHMQFSVGADLRRLFGRLHVGHRPLGLPNQNEMQNCRAWRGPTPTQIFGGPKRSEKPLRDYAHRNLVRAMGPECRCAVRNATACMECKIESCSPPLAAMLHEGVWLRDGKSGGAWGFTARARDGGRVHYAARVVHPSAGASSRMDARCIYLQPVCQKVHAG